MSHPVVSAVDHVTFRPRYKFSLWASVALLGALAVLFFIIPDEDLSPLMEACFALLLFAVFFMPFVIIREIRLAERIYIKRAFLPEESFAYGEVKDIGNKNIQLKGSNIDLSFMKNGDQVRQHFEDLERAGRIDIAGRLKIEEHVGERAERYALPATVVVVVGLRFAGSNLSAETEKVVEGVVGLIVVVLAFIILRRKAHRNPAVRPASAPVRAGGDNVDSLANMPQQERYATWFGPNWESHYAKVLSRITASNGRLGWNWAAALFPPWWVYRKQYAMFMLIMVFEALSTFTVSDGTEPWTNWDSFLLAVTLGGIVFLGSKADSFLFRQADDFLLRADPQTTKDQVAAHGRPASVLAAMAFALWLTFMIMNGN